jgi:hypothetical protein
MTRNSASRVTKPNAIPTLTKRQWPLIQACSLRGLQSQSCRLPVKRLWVKRLPRRSPHRAEGRSRRSMTTILKQDWAFHLTHGIIPHQQPGGTYDFEQNKAVQFTDPLSYIQQTHLLNPVKTVNIDNNSLLFSWEIVFATNLFHVHHLSETQWMTGCNLWLLQPVTVVLVGSQDEQSREMSHINAQQERLCTSYLLVGSGGLSGQPLGLDDHLQ